MEMDKIEGKKRVKDLILTPMQATYSAPPHLKNPDEALQVYLDKLWKYNRKTLTVAWDRVTSSVTNWFWPPPGRIEAECQAVGRIDSSPVIGSETGEFPWVLRDKKVRKMANSYVDSCKSSPVLQNDPGGKILEFIEHHAWAQAQIICNCPNVGFDHTYFRHLGENFESAREIMAAYRRENAETLASGYISVTVPSSLCRRN